MSVTESLTSQQLIAAQCLALGQSHRITAERVGVTKITVTRWLKKPAFKQKVEELKQEIRQVEEQTFKKTVQEEVVETVEANVKKCISVEKLKFIFSQIVEDEELPLAHRIKAGVQLGKWMGLDAPKPAPTQGENEFPVELGSDLPDFSTMSDEELQREYLKTLADD
jgi:transposase